MRSLDKSKSSLEEPKVRLIKRKYKNNTSGFLGVSWNCGNGKYSARIAYKGKRKHIGYFSDPQKAYAAYIKAKKYVG